MEQCRIQRGESTTPRPRPPTTRNDWSRQALQTPVLSPYWTNPSKVAMFQDFGATMQAPLPSFRRTTAPWPRRQTNRSDSNLPSVTIPIDAPTPQTGVQTITGSVIPLALTPQANPYGSQAYLPLYTPPHSIQPEMQILPQPSMKHPAALHYPTQPIVPTSQSYTGYSHSNPGAFSHTMPLPQPHKCTLPHLTHP